MWSTLWRSICYPPLPSSPLPSHVDRVKRRGGAVQAFGQVSPELLHDDSVNTLSNQVWSASIVSFVYDIPAAAAQRPTPAIPR